MHERAFGVVGFERAARAAHVQVVPPHEVVHDELAVVAEQVGERLLALGRVEHVGLLDLDPGQGAPLGADEVAHAGQRLLVLQMRLAGGEPFVAGYDLVDLHVGYSVSFCGAEVSDLLG